MEFDFGVWLGPSSLRCVDGRQLGEENTWPKRFRRFPATEYHETAMAGSRNGCSINMTALHMVMRAWNDALPLMGGLRQVYAEAAGIESQRLTLAHFFVLSKMGCALPALMARRALDPIADGALPALVATQFKLIAGFFMVAQHSLWAEDGEALEALHADTFYDYADRHEIFTSPSGRACGGSRKKILELFDYLVEPQDDCSLDTLRSFVDARQLLSYATLSVHLELTLQLLQRLIKARYLELTHPDCERTRERVGWLRAVGGLQQVRDALQRLPIDQPVDVKGANELIDRLTVDLHHVMAGAAQSQYHAQALTQVQRYAERQQRAILVVLGRSDSLRLTREQVARRLALPELAGGVQ